MISDRQGCQAGTCVLALLSFENHLTANRRTDKPVLHIALSRHAPEDKLDNDRLAELAKEIHAENGMQVTSRSSLIQTLAIPATRTAHIVSVCIDDEGRKSMTPEHRVP